MVLHLAGNALIFAGPDIFNEYSHALISNPLILPIESGYWRIFVIHVYSGITMWIGEQGGPTRRLSEEGAGGAHQPEEPGFVHDDLFQGCSCCCS